MPDLNKIAREYGVTVEWLRQEMARGVDWSTAVDPEYCQWRQAEIDEANRLYEEKLAFDRTPEGVAANAAARKRHPEILSTDYKAMRAAATAKRQGVDVTADEIRTFIAARFRADKVRVKQNGEVHAYGKMPGANKLGWFFAGYDCDIAAEIREARA